MVARYALNPRGKAGVCNEAARSGRPQLTVSVAGGVLGALSASALPAVIMNSKSPGVVVKLTGSVADDAISVGSPVVFAGRTYTR